MKDQRMNAYEEKNETASNVHIKEAIAGSSRRNEKTYSFLEQTTVAGDIRARISKPSNNNHSTSVKKKIPPIANLITGNSVDEIGD